MPALKPATIGQKLLTDFGQNRPLTTTLEKAKARYEAEKDALAELVKMRNELRKEELMDAVINSSRSYEEILAFVKGEGLTE